MARILRNAGVWSSLMLAMTVGAGRSYAEPTKVWVATVGSDAAAGTPGEPMGTLSAALRRVREWRRTHSPLVAEGATIVMGAGVYRLSEPVVVRPEDGGTAEAPTVIAAAERGTVTLSGGVAVTGWIRGADGVAGLPDGARGKVWVAKVPELNGRRLSFRQLWVDERKAVRARSPNGEGMFRLTSWATEREEAGVPEASLAGLGDGRGAEMVVHQMWEIAILRLHEIRRSATAGGEAMVTFQQPESRIQFEHPWPPPVISAEHPEKNSAFYLVNAIGLLDEPGEWFLDEAAGLVYYWPRAEENLGHVTVTVPALETLVAIEGTLDKPVAQVRFEGVEFAHTTWLRPSSAGHVPHQATMFMTEAYKLRPKGTPDWRSLDNQAWVGRSPAAVTVNGAHDVTFEDCRFAHLAMAGLDFERGVRDSAVVGCAIEDAGGNGLQIGFYGDAGNEVHLPYDPRDEREVCARIRVTDNVVMDTANEDWGGVGISAGFVREVVIEHNLVGPTSYSGISVGWGWTRTPNAMRGNVVRANRIGKFATRMADTAGIYMLGAQPGSMVERNVIEQPTFTPWVHDPEHWGYVYLDEGSSFTTVRDNWSPAEKFIKNANGPGNVWINNGPMVDAAVRDEAGRRGPD